MRIIGKIINSEFLTYLVVGGLTAFIYFSFVALSVEILKLDYRVGVSIAYVLAVIFHFVVNRKFTFHASDQQIFLQSIRYFGVLVINYLITVGVVWFFVGQLGASAYLGAAMSILVTVGLGYFASKFWVFRTNGSLHG